MRPRTPPPVPYCHELPWFWVVSGAAAARQISESWRRVLRADWNIMMLVDLMVRYCCGGKENV
jgi:hypothetical protein